MDDRIFFFGTCSGTEPMPGMHHVSFAIRHSDRLYWFDAGECCSFTAHNMGVDLQSIRAIFISHPHMDHIGGLGDLLWNIRKLDGIGHRVAGKTIDLYMPDRGETWGALLPLLRQTESGFRIKFTIDEKRIGDGVIFDEDGVKVTALHNSHLPALDDGSFRSYSFRIDAGGKSVVFSGDTGSYGEIAPLITGADVLLAETGHHTPAEVCEELNGMGAKPHRLMFIHHGLCMIHHQEESIAAAKSIYDGHIDVLKDGDNLPLEEL